ncbi:MAG: amidohydrolase family protein [Gemmatimonadota bacterium]
MSRVSAISLSAIRKAAAAALVAAFGLAPSPTPVLAQQPVAIVGATLIDGNGGEPVSDAVVVVEGERIVAVGPRASVQVPAGARTVDGSGRFLLPGFVDSNVHLSLYSGGETFVRYEHRNADLTREAAQLHLKHGITTVRDSYGSLPPLVQVRDEIARGETVGPRMLVAGNIVGWGGPYTVTWNLTRPTGLTLWQEQMNDFLAQGSGEELLTLTPEELRVAMDAYLDKGPDFIKYGGTGHTSNPDLITFSPRQQRVIVEAAHARGLVAETHSTSVEGLLLSVQAGIDLIQHPEVLDRRITDELMDLIVERGVICGPLSNTITGRAWREYMEEKEKEEAEKADEEAEGQGGVDEAGILTGSDSTEARNRRERTGQEIGQEEREPGMEVRRWNAERMIQAGCIMVPTTDNYLGNAPEFRREPKHENQEAGIGTIVAIEGLVELGMTPMEAIVASTRNGALASRGLDDFGTVEVGKVADLILLEANPLDDIANIRRLGMVMRAGQVMDVDALPTQPVWFGKGMSLAPDGR